MGHRRLQWKSRNVVNCDRLRSSGQGESVLGTPFVSLRSYSPWVRQKWNASRVPRGSGKAPSTRGRSRQCYWGAQE
eukprot:scaffold1253_cov245-Pinguiococcus_pyrenoidosus.AAC.8